jgi:choline dehydrogenase
MYDYVIVGAGSAGCVLANRLSGNPDVKVALVEAGRRDRKQEIHIPAAFSKLFKTPWDWNFSTTPQKHMADREMYWPRGKMIGGSSSINAMMWVRGHRADYDGWQLPGWSYDEVLPYFHRIEHRVGTNYANTYGTNGPMWIEEVRDPNPLTASFLAACGEAGLTRLHELNEPDNTGYAPTPTTIHKGRRFSAADGYLHPVRKRPNLTIITGGLVEKVTFANGRATGVQYRTETGGRTQLTANREVILSAGAIGSPHLLLLSGIGDPNSLTKVGVPVVAASPQVGANLQDHLTAGWVVHTPTPVTMVDAEKPKHVVRYLLTRRGMLASNIAEAVAFIHTEPGLPAPDIELIFAPVPYLDHGFTQPPGHGLSVGGVLLRPRSVGSLSLASADPTEAPQIDPNYLDDPDDVRRLLAAGHIMRDLLAQPSLAPHVGEPMRPDHWPADDIEIEQLMRANAETLYHPVGTARMGTDSGSVVDEELRVRGVEGLRVVDASVMPQIIRGHTHAPTMMIAERGADLILSA